MKISRYVLIAALLVSSVLNFGCGKSVSEKFVDNLLENSSTVDGIEVYDKIGGIIIKSDEDKKVVNFDIALRGTDKVNAKIHAKIYSKKDIKKENLINEFDIKYTHDKGIHWVYSWDGKDKLNESAKKGSYVAFIEINGKKTNKQPVEIKREKEFILSF